ncbi:MAG: lysine--tRNA ligase [Verrucomicrobiota bacterium]|nr:lysine--tRNA ligase [Verrucomicrobiota bacterium]
MADQETDRVVPPISGPVDEYMRARIQRLEELRAQGIDGYGGHFETSESIEAARLRYESAKAEIGAEGEPADEVNPPARLAGRVRAYRSMGKVIFVDIEDLSGRLQVFVRRDQVGEDAFERFKLLELADWIGVEGRLFTTRTGETTLKADSFCVLCKALRPMPEKWHGLKDVEKRYRQRYLDLMSRPETRARFQTRIKIVREIRRFMEDRGFWEVETPMMQPIPGGAAAKPFVTHHQALGMDLFLRIAPELYLKRLLVGGFDKVFEINRNFRNEGLSRRHNPEFTMLEAYEAFGDCRTVMALVEELVCAVAERVIGSLSLPQEDGRVIDLSRPWRRARYDDLVREAAGADWYDLDPAGQKARAHQLGVSVEGLDNPVDVTNQVFEKLVECRLLNPTFVLELPAQLVPLARLVPGDPTHVDVFEMIMGGQEIAPGYSEQNDPIVQRARFEEQAQIRKEGDEDFEVSQILDEDFLTAMEHGMPPAGGFGLGIDRLVMAMTGAESIRDVILFPHMRPLSGEDTASEAGDTESEPESE